ncbi:ribonucleoside-diphosphate reductase subunit alpha [Candidatus Walczuchella monophlebidarum]|uniref:Ribonucleoside-diphosphate reductase n=1 Tax=Candidatus Walczuchella monophlebidarum TaxID=1415657 RepID=A0A068DP33_9FLAO|nr:ribonucleoside-diphosphate reductase subunit alpha [Candidatus Walczuchella monophlebidarum]AID37510.1 ribonucleotide-diphosphate reductase subunit alpha [Candidatus Walczuchella monophlebidarum]
METHPTAKKNGWKVEKDFPVWGNNELYLTTITGGYLLKEETPFEAYKRIAKTAARIQKEPILEKKIFDILWKGWLIPSTPVMGNFGNEKGLPISCFSSRVGDSMYDIYRKNLEMAILSKHGGGTAYDFTKVRPIGTMIKEGTLGTSDGIIPFIKSYDSTIIASKQGCTRRGAVAIYLNIEHKEYPQFLEIREPKGDVNRQCHNIHQGAVISDEFMRKVIEKNGSERELWLNTIKKRVKTGEPYLFFIDNANKNMPKNWKENDLKIWHSNLCTEIMLPTDENHTLVCCLSSLNLYKYDDWKDTDTVSYAIMFLDSVIQEFLDKSHDIHGIEDAVRFAEKSRALGLGVLGWHSYLQSKMIPFISLEANSLTRKIFGKIKEEAERTTQYMAKKYKETLWTKNTGRRNLTLTTVAPTRSSAKLAGGLSQGIEPIAANIYVDDDAKGMHIRKNVKLESLLKKKKLNTHEMWDHIAHEKGSCQKIKALTKREREVFKCFKEINQLELIRQASIRQNYIDQGQSINLAFPQNAPARFINQVHIEAWKMGLKSLYYYRSESILRAETNLYSKCLLCEI